MAEHTNITWCDSTFNPWIGCTKVSPGCDSCYAEALMDKRMGVVTWGPGAPRKRTTAANWRQPLLWEREHEAFELAHGHRRRVFCASLADVFDNEVPPHWRADLFDLIAQTPHLDWLLLTKRIGNAGAMIAEAVRGIEGAPAWPWPHVWLGATMVNQAEVDRDTPRLLKTEAAVRFLSIEPMLEPIVLDGTDNHVEALAGWWRRVDWVIVGGESGFPSRPIKAEWVRTLRDECAAAGVPFFFKQWGGSHPVRRRDDLLDGAQHHAWPQVRRMWA